MGTYRVVHLSDIHFGQQKNGKLVMHDDVRTELTKDCLRMRATIGDAHGVLVTGDTAYAGKHSEYKGSSTWLAELCDAVGCPRIGVRVIPGNHDIDIDEIGYPTRTVHEDLRTKEFKKVHEILDEIAGGDEEGNPLLPKFKAYREFASVYGCDFGSIANPSWSYLIPLEGNLKLRLFGLNSVQVSDKNDNKRRGTLILGNRQYIIPREDNTALIALIHHPLNWLNDQMEAQQYLHSRAHVIMMGHEHLPYIEKVFSETDDERLMISSGATNPPETEYKFTYNWLEFSVRLVADTYKLVVKVYPRIWVREQTAFAPDTVRLKGVDSKEFLLTCTMFAKPPSNAPKPVAVSQRAKAAPDIESKTLGMIEGEDQRFARLRYFFWRFLDWRQRLKVLSNLDILPSTADRPVPQTMERLALEAARTQHKLAQLWDDIMEMVPEKERESNPFQNGKE